MNAIRILAANMEARCRAAGMDHLRRGEPVPEGIWEDLEAALDLQGAFGEQE